MADKAGYEIEQMLQDMRDDYWRTLEAVDDVVMGSRCEYLVIRCGGKRYGLPASFCREVLKLPHLVRVPRLAPHLRGIFNLRGEIVAVTDPCPLFGLDPQTIQAGLRLVVVSEGPMKTALLVELVEGLVDVDETEIEPLADGAGNVARDLFAGKIVRQGNVLVLLDLSKLLGRPELVVDQKEQTADI